MEVLRLLGLLGYLAFLVIVVVGVVVLAGGQVHLVLMLSLVTPLDNIGLLALDLVELEHVAEVLATTGHNMVGRQLEIELVGLVSGLLAGECIELIGW